MHSLKDSVHKRVLEPLSHLASYTPSARECRAEGIKFLIPKRGAKKSTITTAIAHAGGVS